MVCFLFHTTCIAPTSHVLNVGDNSVPKHPITRKQILINVKRIRLSEIYNSTQIPVNFSLFISFLPCWFLKLVRRKKRLSCKARWNPDSCIAVRVDVVKTLKEPLLWNTYLTCYTVPGRATDFLFPSIFLALLHSTKFYLYAKRSQRYGA